MKKTRIAEILYYTVAALIDLFALILIFRNDNRNAGIILLCIGSAMLCFGGALANRYARDAENKQDDKENRK